MIPLPERRANTLGGQSGSARRCQDQIIIVREPSSPGSETISPCEMLTGPSLAPFAWLTSLALNSPGPAGPHNVGVDNLLVEIQPDLAVLAAIVGSTG